MFVTSYSTYIDTSKTDRLKKDRDVKDKAYSQSFAKKLSQSIVTPRTIENLPIDYISNYKAFNNKQKLNYNFKNENLKKYIKTSTQLNAQTTYKQNSRVFSLILKPLTTLSQTPKIDKKLSNDLQELKEQLIRKDMISAYKSNESFFNITAA
jgi:cell fate (sporulation/competence/biofilm development) regulator YlbF (YheA/YmcA/DUF963 family)